MTLTPAEALVLLDPNADQGVQAAKVTFLGLLAEGVLRLEQARSRVFGAYTQVRLARQPATSPPHVEAVLAAVRDSKAATINDIAKRLAKATQRFASFVPALVRPRLVQRGLLEERRHQEQRRTLLLFRRTVTVSTFHPTEAGRREQARLRTLLDEAPAIREALDHNPARAAAMAASLGVLLVLVPSLLPVLGQLANAMGLPQTSGPGESGGSPDDWSSSLDSSATAFGDSLDGALSDAASDSGSDSDGGDGGGGDGGGE
jgi:hypothetical protein